MPTPHQKISVNNGTFTYIGRDQVNHNYPSFKQPTANHATEKSRRPRKSSSTEYRSNTPEKCDQESEPSAHSQSQLGGPAHTRVTTEPATPFPTSISGFEHRDPQDSVLSQRPSSHPDVTASMLSSPPDFERGPQYQASIQGSAQLGMPYSPSSMGGPINLASLTHPPIQNPMYSPQPEAVDGRVYQPTQINCPCSAAPLYPPSSAASSQTHPYVCAHHTPSAVPYTPDFQNPPASHNNPRYNSLPTPAYTPPDPYVQEIYRQSQLRQQSHQLLWGDSADSYEHSPSAHLPPMQDFSDARYFHAEPTENFWSVTGPMPYSTSGHAYPIPAHRRATVATGEGGRYAVPYPDQGPFGYQSR